jgi:hypothetical protein
MLHIIHPAQKHNVCGGKAVRISKPRPIKEPRPLPPKPDFNAELNDNDSKSSNLSDRTFLNVVWSWIYPNS